MIKPTMFDAFCSTMSKSHIARQSARKIVNAATAKADEIEKTAKAILQASQAEAKVSCRVKGVTSTANKIQKKFNGFKDYESAQNTIHEIILGNGTQEIVGDSFGIRYILQKEATQGKQNSLRIYEGILNAQKHNKKNFSLTGFEDYYGKDVTPYGNEQIRDRFAQLNYKTTLGKLKETIAAFTEKESGYTRTNINGKINGINTEIQVGGVHTTKWGDVEHILYDMRQGKALDMSKYTPEQVKLAKDIQKAYQEVLQRKKNHTAQEFSQNYLNKVWDTFRKAETQNLETPIFPEFPSGYPEILKIENILKLAHD